jgi:hypothetical protein
MTTTTPRPYCPQVCDLNAWSMEDMFTQDGRGNCNVGAINRIYKYGEERAAWFGVTC